MTRSRSRSPRWKQRSLSPAFRSPEHHRQRHAHVNYDCEYKSFRKDPKKPMPWRTEDKKYGQSNSRFAPHGNNHQRIYERRSPSPNLKRIPMEDTYSHKPYRTQSSERTESNRRCQLPPKYSEIPYKEHDRPFYHHKMEDRYMFEHYKATGNEKRMKAFHRPLGASCKLERKWHDDDLRHQRLHEEKYGQSPRRVSDEFTARSSLQKRYPEDHDYREYGHTSKRAKEMERYDGGEVARNSKWKQERSFPPYQEKEQRNLGAQSHRSAEREYSEGSVTKIAYEYGHKRRRHLDGEKPFSDDRAQKYVKQEDQKYSSSKGARNSKELDYCSGGRARRTEEGHVEVPVKYSSKKGCNACVNSSKTDADSRSFKNKPEERVRKEGEFRKKVESSDSQHDSSHTVSDMKMSDVNCRREHLTIKVDTKKMVNKYRTTSSHTTERQMSHDLVAVGRKTENFHPVFEHMESVTQNVENDPSREFTQEIITIIHQVKANYFASSDITLHERFSKIQDKPIANMNEVKICLDPEIHRRIDVSLAELQNKRTVPSESPQNIIRVSEDPNDLRHDIERRRKERLKNEDERVFHVDGVAPRNQQSCSLSKLQNSQLDGFQKPMRFIKPPFRKFIGKPHLNSYYSSKPTDTYPHRRIRGHLENAGPIRRHFKSSFADGHLQSHYKSGLVQKGLYIQAKYQRLRSVGVRGFTTNKFGDGFLRKEKGNLNIAAET
ncbi:BCLAF1 and THRAP3 family member 3 isoform X1 [Falco biarmicus]|uniref:BCLAF1 and THRAP3 family member 3 n=1 Tax=Falco rusticolus TaxID=120794 RepID=UPI000679AA76|nr:BCLAF1 and THRAP3 family member 3 [Falco rusticolus]XP_055557953.1 BCLAF1 and THRAP3 family member 3 isoform X1 [Falco cherrug]XP_056184056.1 BCLAF1 and THRAP3 family member 3 isoform X1 [Falco biarmicus]